MENTIEERAKAADGDLSAVKIWEHKVDGAFNWFAARTLRGARMIAREHYVDALDDAGLWAQGDWSEVSETRMDEMKFDAGADANDVSGAFTVRQSFREHLDKMKAEGLMFPRFFASTEY